jgi:hypothetical protein
LAQKRSGIGVSIGETGIRIFVRTLLGALFLLPAAAAGVIGVLWVGLDAFGTEWDYCPDRKTCIAGWKMGAGFIVAAALVGAAGVGLLRGERN